MTNTDQSSLPGLSLAGSENTADHGAGLGPLVRTRADDGVLVVQFSREHLDDPWARELADICLGYAEPECGGWIRQAVSLSMARGATCAGLRALVQISEGLAAHGGRLSLFGVAGDVRAVLRRTGLAGRLCVARGFQDAVLRANDAERVQVFSLAQGFGLFRAA